MAKGFKTGGRRKGSKNRATLLTSLSTPGRHVGANDGVAMVARIEEGLRARGMSLDQIAEELLVCGQPAVIARVWEKLNTWKYGEPRRDIEVRHTHFTLGNMPRTDFDADSRAITNPRRTDLPN
jgi:hypothetical protein